MRLEQITKLKYVLISPAGHVGMLVHKEYSQRDPRNGWPTVHLPLTLCFIMTTLSPYYPRRHS